MKVDVGGLKKNADYRQRTTPFSFTAPEEADEQLRLQAGLPKVF